MLIYTWQSQQDVTSFTVLLVHYPCMHNSMTVTHVYINMYNNIKVINKYSHELSNTIYTYRISSEIEEAN